MGEPIWLDTNTLHFALKGDAAVNDQLASYRNAGRRLLVPPAVANELLNGNVLTMSGNRPVWEQVPTPQSRAATEMGMRRLGVEVDWDSARIPRGQRIDYSMIAVENVSESDRLVLGQIKAGAQRRGVAKPQMITGEEASKAMMSQAHRWGIQSVPAAKTRPGSPPAPPRIVLGEEYPADGKGPISRFFNDRPVLKKLGLIGGSMAAQQLGPQLLSAIEDHFNSSIADARKELEANYPSPAQIKAKAEPFKQAYQASLSKLKAPSNLKAAAAVILALTPPRDIPTTSIFLEDRISKVRSAADGSTIGYATAAEQYIDALIPLHKAATAGQSLAGIAQDIRKRGSVIKAAGDELHETFWNVLPAAAAFPLTYFPWLEVSSVAQAFQALGARVLSLSSDIQARHNEYARLENYIDAELTRVSDELGRFVP
jgi:hypothetical protein